MAVLAISEARDAVAARIVLLRWSTSCGLDLDKDFAAVEYGDEEPADGYEGNPVEQGGEGYIRDCLVD